MYVFLLVFFSKLHFCFYDSVVFFIVFSTLRTVPTISLYNDKDIQFNCFFGLQCQAHAQAGGGNPTSKTYGPFSQEE